MIRPSNLGRIERCPGSVRLEAEQPEAPLRDLDFETFANRGTRLHETITKAIKNPGDKVSIIAQCQDDEEVRIVEACVGEATRAWEKLTPEERSRAAVRIEKKVDLSSVGIEAGTPDMVILVKPTETEDGIIHVLDWKTGVGWVPPARWNLQLMAYAAGSVTDTTGYRAELSIVQPAKREFADTWVASKEDLPKAKDRVLRVVAEAQKPDAPLQSGAWCGYCKAKDRCPARALVAAEVGSLVDPVTVIKTLEGGARTALYSKLGEAVKILTRAKEQVDEAILTGTLQIDGYEIGPGKKGRFWAQPNEDMVEHLSEIAAERGFSKYDVLEAISPSKAEKILGKANIPQELIATKEGNPVIKRVKQ